MPTTKPATIDKVIFGLLVVFAASLTNSIFINQIGYYGALFFLLTKWAKEKESPFRKNGLEFYFAAFLTVEIISAFLSVNSSQAFNNFFKRLLLIPVVYVITAVAINPKRVSKLFFTFLYFSIIGSLLYLWNSYSFYIRGLFQLTGSGPFLFHYPITTSELFSFTALALFPFVIKKELNFKKRALYSAAFLITALSLLATFKRTGWIGFAAGLVVIIILKRKYVYLAPFALGVLFLIFTQKSFSALEVYRFSNGLEPAAKIETQGQVQSLEFIDGKILVSDYDAGIFQLNAGELKRKLKFDFPVTEIKKWRDN